MAYFSVASLEKLVVWETPLPPLFRAPDGSEIENGVMAEGGEGSAMWHLAVVVTIAMDNSSALCHFSEPQQGKCGL